MSKKLIALLCAALLAGSLAGCAKSVSGNHDSATAKDGSTLIGQVQKISGSSLTLALGTLNAPGGKQNGTSSGSDTAAPAMSSGNGNGQTKPDSAQNGAPQGGTAPSGQPQGGLGGQGSGPAGNIQGPGFFTASGETKTVTVPSGAAITLNNAGKQSTGTISDIAAGDIVTVTMKSGTVSAISVNPMVGGPGGQDGGQTTNPSAPPSGSSTAASAAKAS